VFADVLAIGVVVTVFAALGILQMRAQLHYLDAVRARGGTDLTLDHEAQLALRNPFRAFLGISRRTAARSKLMYQRQDDASLEALRRRYFFRRNLWLGVSILGFIALAAFLTTASP
jgi:hypothetical protein